MKNHDSPNRAPFVFAVLLVAQLLLMSLHAKAQASQQSLPRTALLTALYPLQKGTTFLTSTIGGIWYGYINLVGVSQENQKLREENSRLRQENVALQESANTNQRLREMLNLKQSIQNPTLAANVIARDGSPWFKQITIDQGTFSGVKLNQAVITPHGVVGRVVSVGPSSALVQLITDGTAGVGAMLAESRANGELKGHNESLCQLDSISGLNPVHIDEPVLTTGLDGIYPKGLLLGYVSQIQLGSGASLHQISVRPAAQIDRLEEVLIILSKPADVRMTETVKKETK